MKVRELENAYLVRLERGESFHEALGRFLKERGLASGRLSAIGALSEINLGFYHLKEKRYSYRRVEAVEAVSLLGNIALLEGEPVVHAHAAVSLPDFSLLGGHLESATVGATLEVMVEPAGGAVSRRHDAGIGLNLWDI
ncbi:MAG: DNA-binding protein [Chloroflexi bacterium]|nr:DNA-binding protein [Chloroflexota bacterium]